MPELEFREKRVCQKCGREVDFAERECHQCHGNIVIKYVPLRQRG